MDPNSEEKHLVHLTNFEAITLLFKGTLGTAIFCSPLVFYHTGNLGGFILIILMGMVSNIGLKKVLSIKSKLFIRDNTSYQSYGHAVGAAFKNGPTLFSCCSSIMPYIVDILMVFAHFGVCSIYIIFISKNIQQFIDLHFERRSLDFHLNMFIIPLIIANIQSTNLKLLFPIMGVTNIITGFGICLVLYFLTVGSPSNVDRNLINVEILNPYNLAIFLFSMQSIGVVIAVERQMSSPKFLLERFGILNINIVIVMLLHAIVGYMGYYRYGTNVRDSITLNIEQLNDLSQTTRIIICLAIFVSYMLQLYIVVDICWNTYWETYIKNSKLSNYATGVESIVRLIFILITILPTYTYPEMDSFMSSLGSIFLAFLCVICPCLMEIAFIWNTEKQKLTFWIENIVLIFLGLLISVQFSSYKKTHFYPKFESGFVYFNHTRNFDK